MDPPLNKEINILVPMRLSAFMNYGCHVQRNTKYPLDRAFLAPIPAVEGHDLDAEQPTVQHDIYQHMEPAFAEQDADPDRLDPRRQGVYLHWSIPDHYRTAVTATDSTESIEQTRRMAGYHPAPGEAKVVPKTATHFRPLPDRYLILRDAQGPLYLDDDLDATPVKLGVTSGDNVVSLGQNTTAQDSLRTWFVVHANAVRDISMLRPNEDYPVTCSPFLGKLEPSQDSQTPRMVGCTWRADEFLAMPGLPQIQETHSTVVRDGNPFFADFQPLNSSVLSVFDDMSVYHDGRLRKITGGLLHYFVVGWHSQPGQDPLYVPPEVRQSLQNRIDTVRLDLDDKHLSSDYVDRLKSDAAGLKARSLCHGQLHSVRFNPLRDVNFYPGIQDDEEQSYPANKVQAAFSRGQPLAIGTSTIDALYAWLRAQPKQKEAETLRDSLLKLQTYILSNNDDLDSHLQAADLLATNNFILSGSGIRWKLDTDPIKKSQTSEQDLKALHQLNTLQQTLNRAERAKHVQRRRLFELWWLYVSGRTIRNSEAGWRDRIRDCVTSVKAEGLRIQAVENETQQKLSALLSTWKSRPPISHTDSPFAMQRDPTVLVAGAGAVKKPAFAKGTPVRVDGQNTWVSTADSNEQHWQRFPAGAGNHEFGVASLVLTRYGATTLTALRAPIARLMMEYSSAINPLPNILADPTNRPDDPPPGMGIAVPAAFAREANDGYYVKKNGWCPLFVEWEVEFYSVPWSDWELAPTGHEGRLGYQIRKGHVLSRSDAASSVTSRSSAAASSVTPVVIKGRSPVVPHVESALHNTFKQAFAKMNVSELNAALPQADREKLLSSVDDLDYLSATLSGIMQQLVGRVQGTHVVPVGMGGHADSHGVVDHAALKLGSEIGLSQQDFESLGDIMKLTPKPSEQALDEKSLTLGCTHGQLRFSKFSIVDRWGQVVQGVRRKTVPVDPGESTARHPRTSLFPCLGEAYSVQNLPDGTANTVESRNDGLCEFVQIPPAINQEARINANYLMYDNDLRTWRPISEGENPVLGYLVLNSANVSFQIYSPQGTFLREYSIRSGKVTTKPYRENTSEIKNIDPYLQSLMAQFCDHEWLRKFYLSIRRTAAATQARPEHYAESMLGLMGRPLALVHFALDLELAEPPHIYAGDLHLGSVPGVPLKKQQGSQPGFAVPTNQSHPQLATEYEFPVKIGDADNIFDGLYGIFDELDPNSETVRHFTDIQRQILWNQHENVWDWTKFRSYHDENVELHPEFTKLSPHWPHFDPAMESTSKVVRHVAIVDLFVPVHIYSAILPIQKLELPSQLVSHALQHMGAFFQTGPVITTNGLPSFDAEKVVTEDDPQKLPAPTGKIELPISNLADWKWLQPYLDDNNAEKGVQYNVLEVEDLPHKPKFQDAPFTATHGFLQARSGMLDTRVDNETGQ
ncbi:hypothetical protein CBER1_09404 [Cercospora berteroae]|uniref:Uncharacterized protein n=1 Tax=Cercospora berteroae TaxID=357750 RepID=A0A2S6CE20_9PEZI|nr:hypothetical protein CBER1_09404 [Cercospora berteroae]